ncbi:MAG: penicillin-binding protein 2 [Parcubacteria group bacterium]|nr:penicillin-binding protein 2 [Parcubacteria group bacterium]
MSIVRFVHHFRESWRLYLVEILFFIASTFLVNHIYGISIEKHVQYSAKAASQYNAQKETEPRGSISFETRDRLLIPAAINEKKPFVYIAPAEIKDADRDRVLTSVASIFPLSSDVWIEKMEDSRSHFSIIELNPSQEAVKKIKGLKLRGVYVGERLKRFYPNKELGASILGFVTDEYNTPTGQYGVEEVAQEQLGNFYRPADVVLTIDYNIQQKGEQMLDDLMKEWKAKAATLIVEDPKTGAILAMAQKPGFDPNAYGEASLKSFLNQNISSMYEPGSVFKALTFAGAIDAGKVKPETTYYDTGILSMSGYTIRNWDKKSYGTQTMIGVLENSLNTGAAFIEKQLGPDLFLKYVKDFGFGAKTEIDLPGEVVGNIKNLKGFEQLHFATASFGQGIAVTPLQLITAVSAIANKGKLMKPHIIDRFEYSDGVIKVIQPKVTRTVLSEEAAEKTVDALVSVVNHGKIGAVSGYRVGGKTGTAQIPSSRGGYEEAYIHSFVGFAPADDPKFTILIKLVRPVGAPLSGMTVVPAFRELTKFLLDYYSIQPTR